MKEVLLEIGRMANLDIQISPKIDTSIIFTAKNKPLYDVLENITEIANVRYKIVKGIVVFENDDPFVETYNVHFLNISRDATSSKSVSASVGGGGGSVGGGSVGGGGSNQSSSSNFSLKTKSEDKLWEDLLSGMTQIVSEEVLNNKKEEAAKKEKSMMAMMQSMGDVNPTNTNGGSQAPQSPVVNSLNSVTQNLPGSGLAGASSLGGGPSGQQQFGSQGGQQQLQSPLGKDVISINKQGGLVSVYAKKKTHKKIDAYLKLLHKKVMSQVLIEVKVLEVTLNNSYLNGIDWKTVGGLIGSTAVNLATGFASYGTSSLVSGVAKNAAVLTFSSGDFNSAISLLNNFGTVRTVISPRLNATNNQQAVLSRAENYVYFTMSITNNFVNNGQNLSAQGSQLTSSAAQQFSISATPQTVANGVNLTVHPAIDFEKREILMNVRPVISSISNYVSDPGFAFTVAQAGKLGDATASNGLQNNIPITVSKEFDTILKIKDGDMMIMGGFTQNIKSISESGVPFLSEIPGLGWLFKTKSSSESVVETVVLIKATIVDDGEDNLQQSDKDFYNKMANYPRKEELV